MENARLKEKYALEIRYAKEFTIGTEDFREAVNRIPGKTKTDI